MNKGWYWPWIIAALLVATAVGQGIMLYAATHDATFAVEPEYYRRAVAFDAVMSQDAANARLHWGASATLGLLATDGAELVVTLTDAARAPLAGAAVSVEAIHNLDGPRHLSALLVEREVGHYAGRLPLDRTGRWEFRVLVRRAGERFTADLHLDAARNEHAAARGTPK